MADEHPNVALIREGFAAFERGDTAWMADHMADDIVWHVGGKSRMANATSESDVLIDKLLG